MAHSLIALLFSSAHYTTSPSMKPTHAAHHHHHPLLPSLSVSCTPFIFPCPAAPFVPFCAPPPFVSILVSMSVFLSVSLWCCSVSHPHPMSLPLLVLSLVHMCPWSAVAWLGDNRSDFETGGWQPCRHWHRATLMSLRLQRVDRVVRERGKNLNKRKEIRRANKN